MEAPFHMHEPIVPIDQIKREAHAAAEAGESINDACRWPFHTEAGRRFKDFYAMHRAALVALGRIENDFAHCIPGCWPAPMKTFE